MSSRRWLLIAALLTTMSPVSAESTPAIAIIIDDLGYQLDAGRRAIELPGPLALAILPGTPRGRSLAETAHRNGKDVLLHLPLEAARRDGLEEPGGITLDMGRGRFQDAFAQALDSVPFAIGVSSHRGSLLTRHPGHMDWLMHEIHSHEGLFFIDSYTTHKSVALQIAAEQGVAAMKRDVFLDNDRSSKALASEFARLKKLARQRGVAIGIGHPYPETLNFLERELGALGTEDVRLIDISEALARSQEPPPAGGL